MMRVLICFLTVILVSCDFVAATGSAHSHGDSPDFPEISDLPPHQSLLFHFLTGGLTEIVWINGSIEDHLSPSRLSKGCLQDVIHIQAEINRGSEWGFRFADASSKAPAGLMDGTLSSYGDYDQCLAIEHGLKAGQYCGMELKYVSQKLDTLEVDQLLSQSIPSFDRVNVNVALCVPTSCSSADVRSLVQSKLQRFPFDLTGETTCVTPESRTWSSKVTKMSSGQMAAAGLIAMIASVVAAGSVLHAADLLSRLLVQKPIQEYLMIPVMPDLLINFSVGRSMLSLVTVRREHRFLTLADVTMVLLSLAGIWVQAAFMFTSFPMGSTMIHRSHDLKKLVTYFVTRPFFSDALYGALPFMTGYLTLQFWQQGTSSNSLSLIVRKYTILASSCLFVIGMDFLWPIFSQGPFYDRVSDQLLDQCSKTWWTHVTMTANLHPMDQVCAPHLAFASVQMQLLPIGVILSVMLTSFPRIGLRVTVISAVIAILNVYANTHRLRSLALFDKDLDMRSSLEYLSMVLFSFSSQSVNFLIGLLSAYYAASSTSSEASSEAVRDTRIHVIVGSLLFYLSLNLGASYPALPLIQKLSIPVVIILTKLTCCAGLALMCNWWRVSCAAADAMESRNPSDTEDDGTVGVYDDLGIVTAGYVVSFRKAFVRLSFTMYLVSNFVIRLDFFSSRLLYSVFVYDTIKRVCYSGFWSLWIGLLVYLLVVGPVKSLNRAAFAPPVAAADPDKKEQ